MNIRKMETSDVQTIIEYENLLFGHSLGEYMLEDAIESELYSYFVLEDGETLVGYIGLWIVDENGQVMNFLIHPNYQQKGLGKLLFEYSILEFEKRGVETITLEVRPSNVPAIKLYDSFGFKELFRRKKYYPDGEDALFYEKKVR